MCRIIIVFVLLEFVFGLTYWSITVKRYQHQHSLRQIIENLCRCIVVISNAELVQISKSLRHTFDHLCSISRGSPFRGDGIYGLHLGCPMFYAKWKCRADVQLSRLYSHIAKLLWNSTFRDTYVNIRKSNKSNITWGRAFNETKPSRLFKLGIGIFSGKRSKTTIVQ